MRALLKIELKTMAGEIVAVRQARNAVMRGGAGLIADLFAGKGKPITHMGVGTSDAPETEQFATHALTNDPEALLQGGTEAPIPSEAFQPPVLDETQRLVRVRIRATLPASAAIGTVREAGLLSRNEAAVVLYNRVTFA